MALLSLFALTAAVAPGLGLAGPSEAEGEVFAWVRLATQGMT